MFDAQTSLPFFFFTDTATTEIYTLSLHDALPISCSWATTRTSNLRSNSCLAQQCGSGREAWHASSSRASRSRELDRKSTRLNSSHSQISYAVFCLKKKKKN